MAKKGKKEKKSKSTRQVRKTVRRAGPKTNSMAMMSTAMQTCSVTNPFCTEAIGARWPDNSFTKSNGWGFQNSLVQVASDTLGLGATLFTSSMYNTVYYGSVGGTTVSYGGSGNPIVSPPDTARFRVTCYGLRLICPLSKMTATGICHVRFFSPETYASLATTSLNSTMADASYDIPLSRLIDKDVLLIPMPLGTDARLFTASDAPSAVIGSQVNNGWQFVQVGVSGAPVSTVPVQVACYYHFEVIPTDGNATNAFTKAPPASNVLVQNANAGVLQRVGNFFEGAAQTFDKVVKSSALKYGMAAASAYYGNPAPAMALAIRDVD